MALDLSGLSNYVKDNADRYISSLITGAKTAELVQREGNVMLGIKTSERIGVFETDAVFQDGDGCGFNASGTTAITQREITVKTIKLEDSICVKELEKKYTQLNMQRGSNPTALPAPLEQMYIDRKVAKIEQQLEVADWQGDTTSGSANLNKYDGLIKIIDGTVGAKTVNAKKGAGTITATTGSATVAGVGTAFSSAVAIGDKIYAGGVLIGTVLSIGSNTSLTLSANGAAAATGAAYTIAPAAVTTPVLGSAGITASNVIAIVNSVYAAIPEAVLEDVDPGYIFMGWDVARTYLMALHAANMYHYKTEGDDLRDGFILPGTGVKVLPTPGLTGTNRIYHIQPKNMYLGTDLMNEEEEMDMWYEKKDDAVLSRIRFRRGWQIGFPSEVTQWLGAA